MLKEKTINRKISRRLKEKMNTIKKGIPSTWTVGACLYQKSVRMMGV